RRHRQAPLRLRSQRRPRRPVVTFAAGIAAAAAAFAGIAGGLGLAGSHPRSRPAPATLSLAAPFREGARTIGQVRAYGYDPPWLSMTVHDARASGPVTCELVGPGGTVVTLGTFDLVGGSGSWGAPDRAGLAGVTEARLVDSSGRVVATATFS
ncbi:MAG: hypothetical protein ACRDWW_03215, partial [Acidimicrobiales bacterium]